MGFLDKLKNLLIDDDEINDEYDDEVNVQEIEEEVKVNVDPIESIVEEMQDEKEIEVETEVVEEVKVKEEKMHTIDLKSNARKEESKNVAKRQREDAASFILHPVVSPMYGKKGEDIKVEPKVKKEVKRSNKIEDPLTSVISPFFGKTSNKVKEENRIEEEIVTAQVQNENNILNENSDINYVEASQEMVISLQDLLGDDQNDNTVQISLFNDDNFENQDKE